MFCFVEKWWDLNLLTLLDPDSQRGAVCRPLLVADSQSEGVASHPKACRRGNRLVATIQL